MTDPAAIAADYLRDPGCAWSLGVYGAIAEFFRDADEEATVAGAAVVTARGGICLHLGAQLRAVAYELPAATPRGWQQAVAFCVPRAAAGVDPPPLLTELGPDHDALRAADRDAVLFDLGIGRRELRACIRVADAGALGVLRELAGRALFDRDAAALARIAALDPVRVFMSALGRIEVYRPIAPPGGTTERGPHTHLLPHLLAPARPPAAPIPDGWCVAAECHPAHPLTGLYGEPKPFERTQHEAFQAVLERHGDPQWIEAKRRIVRAVRAGERAGETPAPAGDAERAACRVALRQLEAIDGPSPALAAWCAAFEAPAMPSPIHAG